MKSNSKERLADRIKQLINVTQLLLANARQLKEFHDKHLSIPPLEPHQFKISDTATLIRFMHCVFFYDALLNLNTLLHPVQSDPNKKEQSIFELIELETKPNTKEKLKENAESIRQKFIDRKLHKWRHKLVGHKDIDKAGDTEIMYLNFIDESILNFSIALLNEIDTFIKYNYDVIQNNTATNLYGNSFNKLFEMLGKELNI